MASDELLSAEAYAFDDWRVKARQLLNAGRAPESVHWIDLRESKKEGQQSIFAVDDGTQEVASVEGANHSSRTTFRVPPEFLSLAKTVSYHRTPARWSLLYRILWRIAGGERHLLEVASDRDLVSARELEKAVRRDAHKMKAFVRFRKTEDEHGDVYIAWHRPDHYVVPYTADFFARRFDVMRWVILTPDESVAWDGNALTFGPGVARSSQPPTDELESLWKTYYSHIFNPARIKLKAMKAEMPMKHWSTLPETEVIDELLRKASNRVDEMIKRTEGTLGAEPFVPIHSQGIANLRASVCSCQGCDLYKHATQAVFGEGNESAKLVLIGEQPGDREDIAGKPRECFEMLAASAQAAR
jgi:uracil-DNA glycosylase